MVTHGRCNWVGMRCLGMNVISLCECAYRVESIIWRRLWPIYELWIENGINLIGRVDNNLIAISNALSPTAAASRR